MTFSKTYFSLHVSVETLKSLSRIVVHKIVRKKSRNKTHTRIFRNIVKIESLADGSEERIKLDGGQKVANLKITKEFFSKQKQPKREEKKGEIDAHNKCEHLIIWLTIYLFYDSQRLCWLFPIQFVVVLAVCTHSLSRFFFWRVFVCVVHSNPNSQTSRIMILPICFTLLVTNTQRVWSLFETIGALFRWSSKWKINRAMYIVYDSGVCCALCMSNGYNSHFTLLHNTCVIYSCVVVHNFDSGCCCCCFLEILLLHWAISISDYMK